MKPLDAKFDDAHNTWLLQVETALPLWALRAACEYIYRINLQRWRSIPHGDKKEFFGRAVKAAKENKIQQVIIKSGDLFKATCGTGKVITYG